MAAIPLIRLSREVRFGVFPANAPPPGPPPRGAANSFAGNPPVFGVMPFVAVTVTVAGPVDPTTGMLVNIKVIDAVVREVAVDLLRAATAAPLATGTLVLALFDQIAARLRAASQAVERVSLALSPYLHVAVVGREKPMVRLTQRFEFSAAHRLHADTLSAAENADVFGRCNNPNGHGHNYELEVTVAGDPGPTGEVMNVHVLQRLVNEQVIDVFDHKHLNLDCPDFRGLNPTVENIARVIHGRLRPHVSPPGRLVSVRVWETPKTMAEYGE
jgi:6-pyruvoyltetrahydropterin/6-carboxytetrahydropterin synthase